MKKYPLTILIADDDAGIADVTQIVLEQFGYSVLVAPNAAATLRAIKEQKPSLVLLDIWLAGENGADLAKALKRDARTQKLPIIIVSANNNVEKMARESGADDFIAKPFDIDELEKIISKHIHKKNEN